MPGVIRPYSLTDVLATINQNTMNQGASTGANATQFGVIGEVDDPVTPVGDSAAATHAAAPGWDDGFWGAVGWQ